MRSCIVVKDSAALRTAAGMMLTQIGFATREAETAEEAIAMFQDGLPDLILLDWNLPGMSGIDFLKVLREQPYGKNTKVVFCTSNDTANDICQALAGGADEYIMKPFDEKILTSKLRIVGLA